MSRQSHRVLLILLINFLSIEIASAQTLFYKFKITEEGIYTLSADQAKKLGANSLSEIALFGHPGMLPQLLQSENLDLQEIPCLEKNGNLYFYLSSPHTYAISENGIEYHPNHYADTLSFLIGIGKKTRRISTIAGRPGEPDPTILYQWHWLKENENNILNSGRAWYSRAVAPGITRGYAFPLSTKANAQWKVTGRVMARSSAASIITLAADELRISESTFTGVPTSTYAIKGQEISFHESFSPRESNIERLRISYQASNQNDAGYFEFLGVGVPHSSNSLDEGIYSLNQKSSVFLAPLPGLSAWEISDFSNPLAIDFSTGSILEGKKFIVFNEGQATEVKTLEPADLTIRTQSSWPDLLIITPRILGHSAEKLRLHKIGMGIFAEVAYLDEIYDSFGYGNPDVSAIRNFIAWHFHKGGKLQNVLLLGKGTFDYKGILGGRPNLVPIYTSRNSLDPLTTFSSDDYFSFLDFGQGVWEENREGDELMQIGVGRLPVIHPKEANLVVDKIIDYETKPKIGDWKKTVTFFTDDGDNNIHLRDAEAHSVYLKENHKDYKQVKLYLVKYLQEKKGRASIITFGKDSFGGNARKRDITGQLYWAWKRNYPYRRRGLSHF